MSLVSAEGRASAAILADHDPRCAPHFLCRLSDRHGRKFFLVLGTFFSAMPAYACLGLTHGYIDYFWAYPLISFGSAMGESLRPSAAWPTSPS